ncbi:hypothetical protein ACFFK7_11520 [Pseudoalteromonas xiamenensis]|uniref:hypothetical protein n=1 Tax=Pseudoalteromonas xiamenensis TaxID=882626 RepID=UPI0035E6220E
MKAKHFTFFGCLLSLVFITPSSSSTVSISYTALINKTPLAYFLYNPELISPERLSEPVISQLSELNVSHLQVEKIRRLLYANRIDDFLLFAESVMGEWSLEQKSVVCDWLLAKQQVDLLAKLSELVELPKEIEQIIRIYHGQAVDEIPAWLASRLTLGAPTFPSTQCVKTIEVIVDSLDGLNAIEKAVDHYSLKPEPFKGAFCFSKPRYSNGYLQCSIDKQGYAKCHVNDDIVPRNTDHRLYVTQQGLANVRGHVMTLNHKSGYAVLVHELMHFSGFEDEYVFSASKTKLKCAQKGRHAPNLYVGEHGDEPAGWSESPSCQFGKYRSFRPVERWSNLQYQSMPLPDLYRQLWTTILDGERVSQSL